MPIQPRSTEAPTGASLLLRGVELAHRAGSGAWLEEWRPWHQIRRQNQVPPKGDWTVWLMMTGRGWGKTRTAAEALLDLLESGTYRRPACAGATAADVRDVMVEGESGLLECARKRGLEAQYQPSNRRVVLPGLGLKVALFSAEKPGRARGPQHDVVWGDELREWLRGEEMWDNLMLGLRLGPQPKVLATTTPLALRWIMNIAKDEQTCVTVGSTRENLPNLSPEFERAIMRRYAGTRLEQQEIEGLLLEDVEGALWTRDLLDSTRRHEAPPLVRACVGLDPSVTGKRTSDEAGIVAAGLGRDEHGYVLADASGRMVPSEWGRRAAGLVREMGLDMVVAEVNQGGDMVADTIRVVDPGVVVKMVRASRGKLARAEPVSALWEQGRCHMVGRHPELEDELCSHTPQSKDSPNRLDAMVWAMTHLMLGQQILIGRAAPRPR
jgi:phage terminase large subunit-like protein